MRKSISEMAKISGVSVRTLHYYDEIGLLKPSEVVSANGYRYYNEESMKKLQQILFYRELDFSLKEIITIMNTSDYKIEDAFRRQRDLLMLKRKRLDQLIELINANLKGDVAMSFKEFETTEYDQARAEYEKEVKERWGNTDAYAQSRKKSAGYGKEEWQNINKSMDKLLLEFSKLIGTEPENKNVQKLVSEWQQLITDNCYDCTTDILEGLGKMYIADERFTKNMDKFATGTTKLISDAIAVYCKNKR